VYSDTKKPYFNNYEEFLNKNGVDGVAFAASQRLASTMYGVDDDYEAKLPENEFLKEFNFVDEQFRLIDEKGSLISADGKLINEDGKYIDEEGNFVDFNGNPLDDDGNIKVDRSPFLTDEGSPIALKSSDEEKQKKPTQRQKKKKPETADSGQAG